jgi:S1-C subfamily serine protease
MKLLRPCTLTLLLLVLCLLGKGNSQIAPNVQAYQDYFESNYYSLNKIEGIYDVELEIDKPALFCNDCQYSSLKIKDFDQVVIIYRNGRFEVNSIKKGLAIGYLESNSRNQNFGSNLVFRLNAINYPKSDMGGFLGLNSISQMTNVDYNEVHKVFDFEIARNLTIRCNTNLRAELENLFCYNFAVNHNYTKSFPTDDFKPKPLVFTGTGFMIFKSGYVVTNYHVVQKPAAMKGWFKESITLINEATQERFLGRIVCFDEKLDVAVIKINIPEDKLSNYNPLIFSAEPLTLSNSISTVGYPFGDITGSSMKYTKGYVSSETGPFNSPTLYTIDLSINPGNSGGPLFDSYNNVAGVISARLDEDAVGAKVENIGFAIKTAYVTSFLKEKSIPFESVAAKNNNVTTIEKIKTGVFMIEFKVEPF